MVMTKIHLRSGHAIDAGGNVMEFALSRGDLGGPHPYVFEINRVPWTMSVDEASKLASAARMVARALNYDWRNGRRPTERTYFSASPPGPDGPWTIALGIEDRDGESVLFFTFGLSCVRFPPGDDADQLLALFSCLGEDVIDVQRATGAARVQQLQVDLQNYKSPFAAANWAAPLPWEPGGSDGD
jgi:hypothetical protein